MQGWRDRTTWPTSGPPPALTATLGRLGQRSRIRVDFVRRISERQAAAPGTNKWLPNRQDPVFEAPALTGL
jgi:hypothetical protein